jgi:bile acid:Na+ symporter, BASS family
MVLLTIGRPMEEMGWKHVTSQLLAVIAIVRFAPAYMQPLLAVCVFTMMLCIGRDFPLAYWRQLLRSPRPLLIGLLAQNGVVPLVGFALAWLFRATPEIALGIVLIVATPGGPVANAIVHFARARVDVSVSLTTLNGFFSVLTVQLIANWGFALVAGDQLDLRLPVWPTLEHIALVILLPICLGLTCQRLAGALAGRLRGFAQRAALGLLLTILALVFYGNAERIAANLGQMLPAAIVLCGSMLLLSQWFSRVLGVDRETRFAIANEVSVHNVPLAILFAEGLLQRPELAGFVAVYAPVIAFSALGWAIVHRRRSPAPVS